MVNPVFAPYAQTYAQHEPYLTADEYRASPTGVDVGQIVAGGSVPTNMDALNQVMARASSAADVICHQVLAATVETITGRWRVDTRGQIRVVCPYGPVVQVNGFSVGTGPTDLLAATDLTPLFIDRRVVTVPATMLHQTGGHAYATLTYVAGFANSLLTAIANAGASTLTLDNVLGVAPGMSLNIFDPANGQDETVTVQSVTGNVVTLVGVTLYTHAVGVNVSALPAAIKQAVVLLASAIIKTRGSASLVFDTARARPATRQRVDPNEPPEVEQAKMLLAEFARVI